MEYSSRLLLEVVSLMVVSSEVSSAVSMAPAVSVGISAGAVWTFAGSAFLKDDLFYLA